MMSKLSSLIEITLFRARWLLVPLYVGLVAALVLLIYRFALEFVHMIENVGDADAHKFTPFAVQSAHSLFSGFFNKPSNTFLCRSSCSFDVLF